MIGIGGNRSADEVALALMQPQTAPEPFVWGQGGAKLSPQQVAELRAQGESLGQADFSPVGHWSQGLGRALSQLDGGLKKKRAGEMEAENRDYQARMADVLANGDVDDATLARILMDPNAGQGAQAYAGIMMESRKPAKPVKDDRSVRLARVANDPARPAYEREAAAGELLNITDPLMTFNTAQGTMIGRESAISQFTRGGDRSGAAQTTQPPAGAIEELRGDPSDAAKAEFDEVFGAGAAARVLGGQASAPEPFRVAL